MGASLRVPYSRAEAWLPTLAQLRERGFRVVALTPAASAQSLSEFAATVEKSERLIVLVGAEGAGLDAETVALADVTVRIPIDSAIDSLNVVVAAGIALAGLSGLLPASADEELRVPGASAFSLLPCGWSTRP